ncbi:hypothetical protein J3F83DRAFT_422606 [Trichoderma novae-zelandiae]
MAVCFKTSAGNESDNSCKDGACVFFVERASERHAHSPHLNPQLSNTQRRWQANKANLLAKGLTKAERVASTRVPIRGDVKRAPLSCVAAICDAGQSKLKPQAEGGEQRVRSGRKRKWLGQTFELWQSRDISRMSGAGHGRPSSHCEALWRPGRDAAGIQGMES